MRRNGGAVSNLLAEHDVVDVGVGIHVDDAERAVLAMQRTQDGQHDGVVAAQGEGTATVGDDDVVGLFDDGDARREVEGVDSDVADVGNLQAVEGRRPGRHVVGPDEAGLGAYRARPETRAAAVRGTDVERHADEAGVEILGIRLGRQPHHGRGPAEAGHLVAAERLVTRRLPSRRHSVFLLRNKRENRRCRAGARTRPCLAVSRPQQAPPAPAPWRECRQA